MEISLKNKVALVTGGNEGIGHATALALAHAGASVVIASRNEKKGLETIQMIEKSGGCGKALFVKTDITKEEEISSLIQKIIDIYGALHIAFNNAGVDGFGDLDQTSVEEYDRMFNTNVKGLFFSMKYELRAMLKSGEGAIVNTSSIQGHICVPL